MSAPGPGLPPRPRPPGGGSRPAPGGANSPTSNAPPLPAPRSSKISDLAKNFQAGGGGGPPIPSVRSKPSPPPQPSSSEPPSTPAPSLPQRNKVTSNSPSTSQGSSDTPGPQLPQRNKVSSISSDAPGPQRNKLPSISSHGSNDGPAGPQLPQRNKLISTSSGSASFSAQSSEGFGSCLQDCYDTISKRHEDELLALESIRQHIFSRSRFDRDYAEKLFNANMKASKKVSAISDKSSSIIQAWLCFLELSENLQRFISNGAAQMSGVLLHAVDQLIRDKRGAKTAFDQERAKMDNECNASCKAAQELRRSYQSYLKLTETNKKKLEASLAKDPPRLADQERYRRKFVHNAEKLHVCHNEYSLAIVNANIHIDHHRSSLLPFCLDTLQQRMELQITQWKEALNNYAVAMDLTKVYEEQFQQLYNSLKQVEQDQEYVEFVRENKKEPPPLEYYEFDVSLLSQPSAPDTQPGNIVLNNLTYNTMKARLGMLETEVEIHSRDLEEKQDTLKDLMSSLEDSTPLSPAKDSKTPLPKHVRESNLKAAMKDLECAIARKQEGIVLIKSALERMNEDEVPLFHQLGEGVDPKDLDMSQALSGSTTGLPTGKKRGMTLSGKLSTLSKGFRKIGGKFGRTSRVSSSGPSPGITETVPEFPTKLDDDEESDDEMPEYEVPPETPVEEEDWYYGDIDRKVAESKCKSNGDYIVRFSERNTKYVLTCNWNGHGKHFVIQEFVDEFGSKMYRFESKSFANIRALLEYHVDTGTAITKASQTKIVKPVPKHDKWSLSHSDVKIGKKIGKGAFGDVFEAQLNQQKVAVKSCRSSDLTDMDKFMQEADILKQYDHPNVVRLLGVCADEDPVYIVMEFMPGGALLDYLRKKGSLQTKRKLCSMCLDASRGMAYLESKNCIHRDLAARNCLVGDSDIVKISDFGMSREDEGGVYVVSSGTRAIPIKWTAPEALNYGKYTSASDVWSFGILLWEVYSCGSAPYPGMSNHDARSQIEVGYRMPAPTDCPDEVYGVMQQCWQYDPEERPDFAGILEMLSKTVDKIKS